MFGLENKEKNKKTGVDHRFFYYAVKLNAFNLTASLDFLLAALLM